MKFRMDFVTNSSSSSYICDICGQEESGYDMTLSEAEMVECQNGHTFCESHIRKDKENLLKTLKEFSNDGKYEIYDDENNPIAFEKLEEMDADELLEIYLDQDDARYEAPESLCPICNFQVVDPNRTLKYLYRKYGITEQGVLDELSNFYKSFKDFAKDVD